jgi:hypothetical protein
MTKRKPSNEVTMNDDANAIPPREGIDTPFGPPPEEYLYRCSACGREALINEEIIDVTVGTLQFYGKYKGGMPPLICPRCERETWEYVEQDE